MKLRIVSSGLVLLLAGLLTCFSIAQDRSTTSPIVEIKDEPHHHAKFENEFVRVWETILPAGEQTYYHSHNFDNVAVVIAGAKMRMVPLMVTEPSSESETKLGDVGFRSAPYVHRAENSGTTAYDNLLVELLKSPPAPKPITLPPDEHPRHPVLENYRVRVYRVTLAPGESTPMHTHLFAGLALTLSPARIAIQTKGSKRVQRINVRAGEVRWRPEPVTHSIKNIGKTRFEGVDIELK
jgi:quercetin dioxygenase-like cupin family protein